MGAILLGWWVDGLAATLLSLSWVGMLPLAAVSDVSPIDTNAPGIRKVASQVPMPPVWQSEASVGLIGLSGNAAAVNGTFAAKLIWQKKAWQLAASSVGGYGWDSRESQSTTTTAANLAATLRLTRDFGLLGTYGLISAGTDLITSIAHREIAEMGMSVLFLQVYRDQALIHQVTTDIGLRGLHEDRYQFFPVHTSLAQPQFWLFGPLLRISMHTTLWYENYLEEEADFTHNYFVGDDFRANTITTLGIRLHRYLSLTIGYTVHYIGHPAPNRLRTDTVLSTGLSFNNAYTPKG